ncbi:MAG: VOC family protein [Ignavibacteriales bacterium]|nr:VOC family protein [Ignavibacteriales bacterium]
MATTKSKPTKKPAPKKKVEAKKSSAPKLPKWWAKGYQAINVFLNMKDVEKAYNFYQIAFGFTGRGMMKMPDGTVAHAEVTYNNSTVMMGPENPMQNGYAPSHFKGSPASMYVYVKDVDTFCASAKKAGAKCIQKCTDQFWGDRTCLFSDTEGYAWCFASHLKDIKPEDMVPPM